MLTLLSLVLAFVFCNNSQGATRYTAAENEDLIRLVSLYNNPLGSGSWSNVHFYFTQLHPENQRSQSALYNHYMHILAPKILGYSGQPKAPHTRNLPPQETLRRTQPELQNLPSASTPVQISRAALPPTSYSKPTAPQTTRPLVMPQINMTPKPIPQAEFQETSSALEEQPFLEDVYPDFFDF